MDVINKTRNSSIELLRIISMLIIVIYHYNARAFGLYIVGSERIGEADLLPELIMHSIGKLGVPIFVFISGWFGLKYRRERLWEMILMCAFYAILSTVLLMYQYGQTRINDTLFFLNGWWFMAAYICIYVLSPGIEYWFKNTGRWQIFFVIGLFYYISYGDCFLNAANIGGLYLIFAMYLSARWLRLYAYDILNRFWCILLICALLLRFGIIGLGYTTGHLGVLPYVNSYVCPLTTIVAASIFIGFTKVQFKSVLINRLAGSALAVYLFSEGIFGQLFFRSWFPSETFSVLHFLKGGLSVYIVICCIDIIRKITTDRFILNKLK